MSEIILKTDFGKSDFSLPIGRLSPDEMGDVLTVLMRYDVMTEHEVLREVREYADEAMKIKAPHDIAPNPSDHIGGT